MVHRRFGVGEPSTFIICNRDFQVDCGVMVRKGKIVTNEVFESLRQEFSMREIQEGTVVENTTTLRKVRA